MRPSLLVFPVSAAVALFAAVATATAPPAGGVPSFATLLEQPVPLRRGYGETHPRLFFDRQGLETLRQKAARHPDEWRQLPWGYTYSKPNQDIPAGFLLYGLSFAYDLVAPDLEPAERARIESKAVEQGEREQRGTRLTVSTPPQTTSRIEVRLFVAGLKGSQQ